MGINIKLDEKYYITDNSYNTAILVKQLGINKNGKRVEKKRYFPDFGRAIVAWARETGKSGENVTSFQKAAEIFDKKIEEAKTAINESCSISYEKGKKDMLALIKDTYYKADKSEFERLLDAEDENEILNFLRCDYIKQGMSIERDRLLREIKELADRYGIDI